MPQVLDKYQNLKESIARRKANLQAQGATTPQAVLPDVATAPVTPPVAENSAPVEQPTSMPATGTPPVQQPLSQMNEPQPITQPTTQPTTTPETPSTTPPVTPTTVIQTAPEKTPEQIQIERNKAYTEQKQLAKQQKELERIKLNTSLYSTGKKLYDAVKGGSILPGTKEFSDLTTQNPNLLADYNAEKDKNDKIDTVKTLGNAIVGEPVQTPPSNALQQLTEYFTKAMDTDVATEYANTVTNNPAYQSSVQKFNDINQQIADNNNNINKLREVVRKKYSAGTPEELIASAVAREARPLIEQGQYLAQLQQNAEAEMTRIFDENRDMFTLKQEERNQKNQRMIELYGTMRQEEIRQEDIVRADKKLADEIARTDKKDQQTLDRLEQDRLDVVRKGIADLGVTPKGATYDELLGEYANAVRNQPRDLKPFSVGKDSYIFDPATGKYILPPGTTGNAPAPSRKPTIESGYTPEGTFQVNIQNGATPRKSSRGYYECGMLVNDVLGTALGDSYESKMKYANSDVPVVGGAFFQEYKGTGHTGIVESINADGTINIVETNYPEGTGVSRKTIDPAQRKITGYYDPQATSQTSYMDITDITLPEKTSEFKAKSFGYGARMDSSDKILQNIDKKFMESGTTGEYLTPRGDYVPNWLKGTEQQQYEQAQRDFINAKLRQESGAVISPQEFDNAKKQYFPQPGDTDETIKQKAANRNMVIQEMFRNAGKTENGEDISKIYSSIKSQRQTQTDTQSPQEEALIKDLVAQGATDEEIDQALTLFRKK